MSALREIIPNVDFPSLHQISSIDKERCKAFAEIALPLMLTERVKFFHVCDINPVLSSLTDEMLEEVIQSTGEFDGPVYASNTGYNFPRGSYGSGDCNEYHSDGCNQVAIVSTSGEACLHVAWLPRYDAQGKQFTHARQSAANTVVEIAKDREVVGFVEPIATIECIPGTVVRINQPQDYVTDDTGNKWDLVHGLYDAKGQRIALMFRSYGPEGCNDGTKLRRPI